MGAALQPVGCACRRHLDIKWCPCCTWRPQAHARKPQQVGRSRAESADNVQGAFRVADEHRANITGRRRCAGLCAGCSAGAHSHIKDIQTRNNAMPPIEIYTTRYCSFCAAAKALLTRKGVSYSKSTSAVIGSAGEK